MNPEELSAVCVGTGTKQLNSCSPGKCQCMVGMVGAGHSRVWDLQQELSQFLFSSLLSDSQGNSSITHLVLLQVPLKIPGLIF